MQFSKKTAAQFYLNELNIKY